jgi:[protein-PII] uridylyltransferase
MSLIDPAHFADALRHLGETQGEILALRSSVSKLIRTRLAEAQQLAWATLKNTGNGTRCARALSDTEDMIISAVFHFATAHVFPTISAQAISVIAVGGYGRGTLAPGSDIDLLFLMPPKGQDATKPVIEFLLYALWDARQKVGHATRDIDDCIAMAKSDFTILTAMLEARFICGDDALFQSLTAAFRRQIVQSNAKAFVASKLGERDQRHQKSGESRYMVEPDLKDGKGGLRDLHTLFWIAKFLFAANTPEELAEKGAFSHDELRRFQKCEDFLWAVRCHLHFVAKRGEDKLSFDRQDEVALLLGYRGEGPGLRRVERFMKHYFLIAKDVGDLTRIFCAALEEKHLKDAPTLSRVFARFMPPARKTVKGSKDFRMESGRLDLVSPDGFMDDPANLIRIFKIASDEGVEIHPDALKAARESLRLIDDGVRLQTGEDFVEMLATSGDPETMLRMMNEAGVLGRFIPEFGKIVAMMQFNMYHHFTVDEHLIRAVGVLHGLENGTLSGDHPLSVELFPTLTSRRALFVATLLHDVAKGRQEDHSVAGEREARAICPRLGLSSAETETVAWLIRHHLLMSETAQMRDLNDFKTILDFCAIVQSPEQLKLLLILTVADIRAVGPGVWNGWKGQLLRTLYTEAEPLLTGGHTAVSRKARVTEAQERFVANFPSWTQEEKTSAAARHYDAYWLTVDPERQLRHQAMVARALPRDVTTDIKTDAFAAITEITIFAPDHPRLLAMMFGACTAANGNIVGAQIFTTTDGMALDTILLQREFTDDADEQRRAARVCQMIMDVLRGQVKLSDALANLKKSSGRAAAFTVAPRVLVDNSSSNRFTVIEINGLDRVGLLHGLTEALFHLNINITSAHITTFGEKAVDVFYITDLTGAKIVNESRQNAIERALMAVLVSESQTQIASA